MLKFSIFALKKDNSKQTSLDICNMPEAIRPNTDEVFVSSRHDSDGESVYYISENALVYVASGEIDILIDGDLVANFKKGECVFVRKDHRMTLISYATGTVDYHLTVFLFFPRQYLFDYYKKLQTWDLPVIETPSDKVFINIPRSSLLTSLFDSFKPYWEKNQLPEPHWLRLKVLEAIKFLLLMDKTMYATLFDFTSRWRLDIMDFMERNYKYNLTLEQLAHYTGRSVATFKRDFRKISQIPPAKWVINRRLREARHLLSSTDWPVYKIMNHLGFKNFSHFSRCYHQLFGETPSATRSKLNEP